ncbi:MAG: protocatechuate 3,4-dioxygenase [Chromatiales bacterium]|nr:protocatechuate 3,4-dioxygenase [Chromatiales bacterium]
MKTDLYRRRLMAASVAGATMVMLPVGLRGAAKLLATPRQTSGPFYPVELPLDDDNDLVQFGHSTSLAKGEITHLTGEVVDVYGHPVSNARVEIWQCDAHGRYHHPRDRRGRAADPNFQGHGSFQTGDDGRYRFRTIRPIPYPGRTPHIHFAVSGPDFEPLVTQMYVAGEPLNESDFVLNSIRDTALKESLIVDLLPAGVAGEWTGHFRIVLAADGRFQAV